MLTPARPSKGDPLFKEKMVQFRLDQEDRKRNPPPPIPPAPPDDEPASDPNAELGCNAQSVAP